MTEDWGEFVTQRQCLVKDTGHHGILFGGIMLQWLDEAGAMYAEEATRAPKLLTRALEAMEFIHPVAVGENVRFYAATEHRGRTSIKIRVRAYVVRPRDASFEPRQVTDACMTFVSVDKGGHPRPIDWSDGSPA
jgi:acyl-CoA thioesterase YciA